MKTFTENTSLIIPTRNRPYQVINLLKQFKLLKVNFFEILIIDSSDLKQNKILKELVKKFTVRLFHTIPSTSFQRNYGLIKKNQETEYVMFLDDDVIFFQDAFYEMNKLIIKYKKDSSISCFGFNQIHKNLKKNPIETLKHSKLIKLLGIYSDQPGSVLRTGWHTKILNVKKNSYVDWMYTTACVYKSKVINCLRFDESLGKYSYLEDLDFSLNLKKIKKKIIISYLARFVHPLNIDRSSFLFGIAEVFNRYKIVKKYNLSVPFFFIGVFLRFLLSLLGIIKFNKNLFLRALGNILGVIKCLKI